LTTIPKFIFTVTPGAEEALTRLATATEARDSVRLIYPKGVRPFGQISRSSGGATVPALGVTAAEFDAARVAYESYELAVASADREVVAATKAVRTFAYGVGLSPEVIEARQLAAAERLVELEETLATAPLTQADRQALEAERILAERYAIAGSPSILEGIAERGSSFTVRRDNSTMHVDGDGVRVEGGGPFTLKLPGGRTVVIDPRDPVGNGQSIRSIRNGR